MSTRAIAAIFLMALSISYASATELSVTLSNPGPIPLGDHQQITIAYAGVPEHAGLVVSVVPDIPESEFEKHGVYGGLLVLHPVPISGSGLHTIEWDTKNIGCAPTDMPMWCAALQIGRYRIKAEAFNASSFNLLGMFPGTTKPQSIFVAQSQSFTISGEPDLSPVIRNLDQAAFEFFAEAAGVPSLQIDQSGYLDTTGTLQTYYWTFCKLYKAKRPFSGEIRACMPRTVVGPFGVNRRRVMYEATAETATFINPAAGVLPYDQALTIARDLADSPYQKLIAAQEDPKFSVRTKRGSDGIGRPAGANVNAWIRRGWGYDLSAQVSGWRYVTKDEAWIFVIDEIQTSGSESAPNRFADRVMVRVEHDGRACVVRSVPYKGRFEIDDGAKACP